MATVLLIEDAHDIRQMVEWVVDEIRPALEKHTVGCVIPNEACMVDGDELRLEQVLQNLLSNAVKYSPRGGQIVVRVDQCNRQVCVSIRDSGIGIPAAAIPKLFHRFYRLCIARFKLPYCRLHHAYLSALHHR